MKLAVVLTEYCAFKGFISEEEMPWLQYILEKRLSTLLIYVPLLIIGAYLASPVASISFLASFLFLRKRTSGIHAKTFGGCFCGSIASQVLSLGVLLHALTLWAAIPLLAVASAIIIHLAPFNHPSMHLSKGEVTACAISARNRVLFLDILVVVFYILNDIEVGHSILLGIAMTAVMLVGANIMHGRNNDEKPRNSNEKGNSESDCQSYGPGKKRLASWMCGVLLPAGKTTNETE